MNPPLHNHNIHLGTRIRSLLKTDSLLMCALQQEKSHCSVLTGTTA